MGYPELATMYNNGMGATASLLGGQMASSAQAQDAETLKKMQLENQQAAVINPLNAQFKQGQINQQGAELPGIVGNSQSLSAKGTEDTSTMSTQIASKISSMSTQIGANGMQQMAQDGEKLRQAAAITSQYPPALRKQIFAKAVQQYGGDVNSPMIQGLLQAPDEQFQTIAEATGKGMALAGSQFIQGQTTATAHGQVQKDIATGNNDTAVEVAKIAAQSRVDAAEKRAAAMGAKVDVIQQLLKVPMAQRNAEWNAQYESAMTSLTTIRAATGSDLAAAIVGGGQPQTTSSRTATAVDKVTSMNKGGAITAQPAIPAGYKQVGTSGGIPVIEGPDGKRYTWGK